tara:strand:+ start:563 stop:1198 length:636 start_codon:yes stop_codon:yes gene_type:complete
MPMGVPTKHLLLASMLLSSTLLGGCLTLTLQREIMESWREPPERRDTDITVGFSHSFETDGELDSVFHENSTVLVFDETVSMLVINFVAKFPYSSTMEDLVGNDTNEIRYVEARLWAPGSKASGEAPFWETKATQDITIREEWEEEFTEGTWELEVEARAWGVTTPIEQLSFHDSFSVYATITKPCVHFPNTHGIDDNGDLECTFLSDLEG